MQWEYMTTFLEAEARYEEDFLRQLSDWKSGIPVYTPESLIPRLNAYGEQGWELIHMEPVGVGNNRDVIVADNSGTRFWTHTYFGVFKRAKGN